MMRAPQRYLDFFPAHGALEFLISQQPFGFKFSLALDCSVRTILDP